MIEGHSGCEISVRDGILEKSSAGCYPIERLRKQAEKQEIFSKIGFENILIPKIYGTKEHANEFIIEMEHLSCFNIIQYLNRASKKELDELISILFKFIKKSNVETISFSNENPIIKTNENVFKFDKILIACGAFSKKLTDQIDEKIPLDTERGYHINFKNCDHLISRPVVFSNRGFGMTPMEQGLRVVGTVEFGGLDNPASKSRIKNLVTNAKFLLDGLPEHDEEWLGFRPTLPDYLPVIGPSKNYKNVFYSFGHHHLGWTLGAISGKIVSSMMAEENTNLDLKPYSSLRFE